MSKAVKELEECMENQECFTAQSSIGQKYGFMRSAGKTNAYKAITSRRAQQEFKLAWAKQEYQEAIKKRVSLQGLRMEKGRDGLELTWPQLLQHYGGNE
eukprot:6204570-Amphidinium_carterae.1